MYALLAADYDLTLSREDRTVSPRVREAIGRVFARGKIVTLASGRLSDGAAQARALFPADVPLILCNGGVLARSGDGAVLEERVMEPEIALRLLEWCAPRCGATILWCRAGLFSDRDNIFSDTYARLSFTEPKPLVSPREAAASGVYKILLLGTAPEVLTAQEEAHSLFAGRANAFRSSPEVLELVPPGVDKGSGLRRLSELLEIPREQIVALGDGENDISMLRWAGLGVAMGNAPDSVKAAADLVAPPCSEDGAAWVMERFLLE